MFTRQQDCSSIWECILLLCWWNLRGGDVAVSLILMPVNKVRMCNKTNRCNQAYFDQRGIGSWLAVLTGPSPCSCWEPLGSRTGWMRGPAGPAPQEQTRWVGESSGCLPQLWSHSRTCSVRRGSLAPPGEWKKTFYLFTYYIGTA